MGRKSLVCVHGVFYLYLRDSVWTLKLQKRVGQFRREYQDHRQRERVFLCKNSNNNGNVILTEILHCIDLNQ